MLSLEPVQPSDLEALFALRMEAMRESLTRLGLTDLEHSRSRYAGQCEGGGVGAWVLDWAKSHGKEIRLSALKFSASNRFYLRHGFEPVGESELDIQYRWIAPGTALA